MGSPPGNEPENRQARSAAGCLGVVVVTVVALALGVWGWLSLHPIGGPFCDFNCPRPNQAQGVILLVVAAVVLFGGLWGIARLGSGQPDRNGHAQAARVPSHRGSRGHRLVARTGLAWRVVSPGVEVTRMIDGDVVGHLEPGARVTEVQRLGRHVRVSAADGMSGWVLADRLEPLEPGGEGGG